MTCEIPLLIVVVVIMALLFGFLFVQMERAVKEQHRRGDPK